MPRKLVAAAVVLPLLAIGLGIVRAELTFARTRDFTFEITGYDPRDLLRGHYLQFRLQLEPMHWREDCTAAAEACCVCLTQASDTGLAQLERASCSDARSCDGYLEPQAAAQAFRYYIPDVQAAELERKLMDAVVRRAAHARIAVDADGQAHVRTLYVDGQPITGQSEPPAQ